MPQPIQVAGADAEALLTAAEAAAYLDVPKPTLYAYVSRGLLESVADPADARRRRYRRSDLDRLRRRSDAHAGHGAAAASALDWGAPSLTTSISEITPEGPSYRGRPVAELVGEGVPFESVAELLWTGELPPARPRWPAATAVELGGTVACPTWPVDVLHVATTLAGLEDPLRFGGSEEVELAVARRLVTRTVSTLVVQRERVPPAGATVAELMAVAFGAKPNERLSAAIDAALVALADHELNASTFAARVTASTGADVYACVSAALAAFSGPRHGGACDRCVALLAEIDSAGSVRAVLTARLQRGESPPGFGHVLYPEGDPRFALLRAAALAAGEGEWPETFEELVDVAMEMGLGAPTSDLGLVMLARALGLGDSAAVALFAVGRLAGWIAHAYEQRRQGFMLRPRARYVGP